MPRVEPDSEDAWFSVSVYVEQATYFSTHAEAEAEFQRLRATRQFGCGELYEWDEQGDYEELDSFNHYEKADSGK